jgi:hypothetical protein
VQEAFTSNCPCQNLCVFISSAALHRLLLYFNTSARELTSYKLQQELASTSVTPKFYDQGPLGPLISSFGGSVGPKSLIGGPSALSQAPLGAQIRGSRES